MMLILNVTIIILNVMMEVPKSASPGCQDHLHNHTNS
jgi:hypothetical protein